MSEISGDSESLCPVCKKLVTSDDLAVQCDSLKKGWAESNHWTHAECLENTQLLNGSIVPLSASLFKRLAGVKFHFLCPMCSNAESQSLPLPLQLLEQKFLSVAELKRLGVFSEEIERWVKQRDALNRVDSTASEENKIQEDLVGKGFTLPNPPNVLAEASSSVNKSHLLQDLPKSSTLFDTDSVFRGETDTTHTANLGSIWTNTQFQEPLVMRRPNEFHSNEQGNLFSTPDQTPFNPIVQPPSSVQPPTTDSNLVSVMQGMMNLMLQQQQQQQAFFAQQIEQQQAFQREQTASMAAAYSSQATVASATKNKEANSSSAGTTSNNEMSSSGFARLPKVEMPTFSGSILEWHSFWDMFTEMVDKHSRFSDVEKLHFLLTHLSGEAKRVVSNYKLEAANYLNVVAALKERFDDKSKIRAAHFQALMSLSQVTNLDAMQLQKFQDQVDSHSRALIALTGNDESIVDLQCFTVVSCLFEKLPIILRAQMFEHDGEDVKTHLSKFRASLKNRIKVQVSIQGQSWVSKADQSEKASSSAKMYPSGKWNKATMSGSGMIATEPNRFKKGKIEMAVVQWHTRQEWTAICL